MFGTNMIAEVVFVILCLLKLVYSNNTTSNDDFIVINTINFPLNFTTENAECKSDIDLYSVSLKNNTLWAYRMWESSARLPLGLTEGSQYQLGNFDECLSIREPFATQYCLATIHINIKINRTNLDPFSLEYKPFVNLYEKLDYTNDPAQIPRNQVYWSLCLPASCPVQDIQRELQKYLNKEYNNSYIEQFQVDINYEDCQTEDKNDEYKYTGMDILFCCVIFCFILSVGTCTIYDLKYSEENSADTKLIKILLCFSARKNYLELYNPEGSNNKLHIFYGVKFLLMVIAIIAHGLVSRMMGPILNFNPIEKISRSILYMFVNRIDVMIAIFFLIGGILNTYSFLSQTEKKTFNAVRSIVLRYFRFVPILGITTFFYATLFYKTGSGPLWPKIIGKEKHNCEQNWWTNLLLMNNYINVENTCILQSWYICIDFQLFILSIPINYLIKKNSKLCWTLFATVLFGTLIIPFLLIYIGGKIPVFYVFTNFFATLREVDYYKSVYVPAHTRMSSYIIGMFFGFIYYKFKDSKCKISLIPSIFVIALFGITLLGIIFSGMFLYNPYVPYDLLTGALFSSINRVVFAIVVGLILFIISYGSISLLPTILTWYPIIALSKLSFSAYLIHFVFELPIPASARNPLNVSIFDWVYRGAAELLLSFAAAFVLFICIENPCIKVMKELIPINFCKRRVKIKDESQESYQ